MPKVDNCEYENLHEKNLKDSGQALYCNLESITRLLLHASSLGEFCIFLIQFSTDKVADRFHRFIYASSYAYENLGNNYSNV